MAPRRPGRGDLLDARRRFGPAGRRRDRDREDAQRGRAARAAAPRHAPERRPSLRGGTAVSCRVEHDPTARPARALSRVARLRRDARGQSPLRPDRERARSGGGAPAARARRHLPLRAGARLHRPQRLPQLAAPPREPGEPAGGGPAGRPSGRRDRVRQRASARAAARLRSGQRDLSHRGGSRSGAARGGAPERGRMRLAATAPPMADRSSPSWPPRRRGGRAWSGDRRQRSTASTSAPLRSRRWRSR